MAAGDGTIIWLNRFDVLPPFSRITSISVSFGNATVGVPDGTPVTVALWKDPNNDGDPTDAVLLATAAGVTANNNTNLFNVYDIPDTDVGSGTFFVGARVTHATGEFPAAFDGDSSGANSWLLVGPAGSTNVDDLAGVFQLPDLGAWMVRANAEASAVPEPATLAVFGLMTGVGLVARRRRTA